MLAYPFGQEYKTKKLLIDAIKLANVDVVFVIDSGFFGWPKTKKLSDMKDGEILSFCGPNPQNIRYYGRVAKQVIGSVSIYEVE